jgi:hypothetical protein
MLTERRFAVPNALPNSQEAWSVSSGAPGVERAYGRLESALREPRRGFLEAVQRLRIDRMICRHGTAILGATRARLF